MPNSIKKYREQKGWTQEDLGKKAGGMPQSAISIYEKGTKQMMVETMLKISRALSVAPEKLLKKPRKTK